MGFSVVAILFHLRIGRSCISIQCFPDHPFLRPAVPFAVTRGEGNLSQFSSESAIFLDLSRQYHSGKVQPPWVERHAILVGPAHIRGFLPIQARIRPAMKQHKEHVFRTGFAETHFLLISAIHEYWLYIEPVLGDACSTDRVVYSIFIIFVDWGVSCSEECIPSALHIAFSPISDIVQKNADTNLPVWPLPIDLSPRQPHGEGMPKKLVCSDEERFRSYAHQHTSGQSSQTISRTRAGLVFQIYAIIWR